MVSVKTLHEVNFSEQCVLVRCDFNVPFDKQGRIADDTRIVGALPTIRHLVAQGAKVILCSHLGRPKGERQAKYTLAPIAVALAEHLGQPVAFVSDCIGKCVEEAAAALEAGQVLLLENLRYHPGEEQNDPVFARELVSIADAYVNDAFGTAHRAHASTEGVTHFIETKVAGFLLEKELDFLGHKTTTPERPFVVLLGGAKVSDKITVIEALLEKADVMLIGGAMAYTFALALGQSVGNSLAELDKVETARACLAKAEAKGVSLRLPIDHVMTDHLDFTSACVGQINIAEGSIPEGWEGIDIGPKTVELYQNEIARASTLLWNGPMGIFEIQASAAGTFAVAQAVAEVDAISIIGGGDSVKALHQAGYGDQVTFISTGGGASLEFLEGKTLPGVAALRD